jgi:hypothetical protein
MRLGDDFPPTRSFPEEGQSWDDIVAARSLAKPPWLRGAARCLAAFGWPHYKNVTTKRSAFWGRLGRKARVGS